MKLLSKPLLATAGVVAVIAFQNCAPGFQDVDADGFYSDGHYNNGGNSNGNSDNNGYPSYGNGQDYNNGDNYNNESYIPPTSGGGFADGGYLGGGSSQSACGAFHGKVIDHSWDKYLGRTTSNPIVLWGDSEVFSLKLIKPKGVKGGMATINAVNYTMPDAPKRLVISECPGSMKPAGEGYCEAKANIEGNYMEFTFGAEGQPKYIKCVLEPNKQYYINVQHYNTESSACRGGKCYFAFIYNPPSK